VSMPASDAVQMIEGVPILLCSRIVEVWVAGVGIFGCMLPNFDRFDRFTLFVGLN
jgi:hypothetical protein